VQDRDSRLWKVGGLTLLVIFITKLTRAFNRFVESRCIDIIHVYFHNEFIVAFDRDCGKSSANII
jgi:hypothetical protein